MVDINKELETKTLSKIMAENLAYYVEDPRRRCVDGGNNCKYSPKNADKESISEGCFIGRFLTPEQQQKLDIYQSSWSVNIINDYTKDNKGGNDLPQSLVENIHLFRSFQNTHDNIALWNPKNSNFKSSLSNLLNSTIEKYPILDKEDFKEFLV